jgi:hypothetical protein
MRSAPIAEYSRLRQPSADSVTARRSPCSAPDEGRPGSTAVRRFSGWLLAGHGYPAGVHRVDGFLLLDWTRPGYLWRRRGGEAAVMARW